MGTWRFRNVTQAQNFDPLLGSVTITNQQPCQLATFDGEVRASEPIAQGDEVAVYYAEDNVTEVKVFAGDVSVLTDAHVEPGGDPALLRFSARDFTARLDDTVLTSKRGTSESATDRIAWIMAQGNDFGIGTSGVASISDTIDPFDYTTLSRREALSQVAGVAAAVFYVDFDKELHFYPYDTVVAADFALATPANPPTSYAYRNFTLDHDVTEQPDVVFVQGDGVARWVPNAPGGTDKARALTASGVTSSTMLQKIGAAELLRSGTEQQSGSLEMFKPGLSSGETVHITNPAHGIDDDFIISSVNIRPFAPNGGDFTDALYGIDFADRLLCIPQIDTTRDTTITKDPTDPSSTPCDECQRRIILTTIDSNISMATGAGGGLHVYDGTVLQRYSCALDPVDENTSAATTLGYIRHEPGTHTALSTGDVGLYGYPPQGPYGEARYDISGSIVPTTVDVTDRRTFWVGAGGSARWVAEVTGGSPTWGVGSGSGYVQGGSAGSSSLAQHLFTLYGTDGVDNPSTGYDDWNGGSLNISTDTTNWPDAADWTNANWSLHARFKVHAKNADTAIWIYNWKGYNSASNASNALYIEPDGGEYSLVDKNGTLDTSTITLTDDTWYELRWIRDGTSSRVRIWQSSLSEPGTWDLTVTRGAVVYSAMGFHHFFSGTTTRIDWDYIDFDTFSEPFTATATSYWDEGAASAKSLQYRSEEDGSLIDTTSLSAAPTSSRRTPDGQHVFVQQGNDTLVRYNRRLELEDTVTISGFFPVQDWNCDDQFTLTRISANVLYRYNDDGTLAWSTDLNAAEGYRFPSLAPSGGNGLQLYTGRSSGSGAFADGYYRVIGYRGGATWTSGESDAMLLVIRRSDGVIEDVRRWGGEPGDHAQAMAMVIHGNTMFIAGAASGSEFEEEALSGTQGFIVRVCLGLTGSDGGTGTTTDLDFGADI